MLSPDCLLTGRFREQRACFQWVHCCLEQQRIPLHVVANLTATAEGFCRLSPALADAIPPFLNKTPDACFSLREHCHPNDWSLPTTVYEYDDGFPLNQCPDWASRMWLGDLS